MGALINKWKRDRDRRRNDKYLGGAPEDEKKLYEEAAQQRDISIAREDSSYRGMKDQTKTTQGMASAAETEYRGSKNDSSKALKESRDAAYGIGEATSGAKSALTHSTAMARSERQKALATNSMKTQAESAILANQQAAQQQLAANNAMMNRQSRGLAGSMGEGGALAMQQAMMANSQSAGDALTANQLQQNQMANDMRYQAAAADREAQLAFAQQNAADMTNMGQNVAQTGMAGAQAQQQALANQSGLMQNQQQLASQRQLGLTGQANQMATGLESASGQNLNMNQDYQSGLLTAKFGAQSNRNQTRSSWKQALFPMGILGGN